MNKPNVRLATELPSVRTIYYGARLGYAMEYRGGFRILTTESQVRQHLVQGGVPKGEIDFWLCKIREENYVAYIGTVAGFPPGLYKSEDSGEQFLVTKGPEIIEGVKGGCPFIWAYLTEMLDDPDQPDQFWATLSWMAQGRQNLIQKIRRPLPAVVLVGPKNCGKTLFIEILRLVLGGRAAGALAALNGTTNFNSEIIGAEVLNIDDEIVSRDHRARVALAQGLKKWLFASSVRVEGKNKDALSMRPIQVLIIAVNSEAEHLAVIPNLDDSLRDKISLLNCQKASLDGLNDRKEIARRIAAELPALIYYLENEFEIPAHLRDTRTGAGAWQHASVIEMLAVISPEERFRELLQQCDYITQEIKGKGTWKGSATDVEKMLHADEGTRQTARHLLSWNGACGSYLSRLAASGRCSIEKTTVNGSTRWKISNLEGGGGGGSCELKSKK